MKRWKVTLVDRTQQFRFPRSKKRRIRKKWHGRPENWRPLMVPVGICFALGRIKAGEIAPGPYWDEGEGAYDFGMKFSPRILEMHTALWEKVKAEQPEFAALCDLFRRTVRHEGCIEFQEDIPIEGSDFPKPAPKTLAG